MLQSISRYAPQLQNTQALKANRPQAQQRNGYITPESFNIVQKEIGLLSQNALKPYEQNFFKFFKVKDFENGFERNHTLTNSIVDKLEELHHLSKNEPIEIHPDFSIFGETLGLKPKSSKAKRPFSYQTIAKNPTGKISFTKAEAPYSRLLSNLESFLTLYKYHHDLPDKRSAPSGYTLQERLDWLINDASEKQG